MFRSQDANGTPTVESVVLTINDGLALAAAPKIVIDPFAPVNHRATHPDMEDTAVRLNVTEKEDTDNGLAVGSHNLDHKLQSMSDGATAHVIFAGLLDDGARLELDLYGGNGRRRRRLRAVGQTS